MRDRSQVRAVVSAKDLGLYSKKNEKSYFYLGGRYVPIILL